MSCEFFSPDSSSAAATSCSFSAPSNYFSRSSRISRASMSTLYSLIASWSALSSYVSFSNSFCVPNLSTLSIISFESCCTAVSSIIFLLACSRIRSSTLSLHTNL